MKEWHIKSHNILLSGDGENTNSLQFNGIWIKFMEQGRSIITQTHQCAYIDTVTARGEQGLFMRISLVNPPKSQLLYWISIRRMTA
ncbi:hypothetical protein HDF26_004701 [Pedobacter cryoconitis]|nr:hypothetical protein [Pedobacter cryoconitis]